MTRKKKRSYARSLRSRKTRGRVVRSMAKTTKRGKGRISKRRSYKKAMK